MWKKLTIATKITPTEDDKNNVPKAVKNDNIIINVSKPSNDKAKRPDPVIRASNSVSNQDFLALAVIEGNLSKVQSVVEAYTALLGMYLQLLRAQSFTYLVLMADPCQDINRVGIFI